MYGAAARRPGSIGGGRLTQTLESNMTLVRFALGTGFLAFAAVSLSCDREAGAPDATVTVRSALNSNVVVTVVDGANTPQVNIKVWALKNNGVDQANAFTNASGQATLSLPASSYRFAVYEADNWFYSGAVGHCVTPSCTTASITINRVDVTVVDTNGTPQVGQEVFWENSATDGGFLNTNASGHVLMAVPPGIVPGSAPSSTARCSRRAPPSTATPRRARRRPSRSRSRSR